MPLPTNLVEVPDRWKAHVGVYVMSGILLIPSGRRSRPAIIDDDARLPGSNALWAYTALMLLGRLLLYTAIVVLPTCVTALQTSSEIPATPVRFAYLGLSPLQTKRPASVWANVIHSRPRPLIYRDSRLERQLLVKTALSNSVRHATGSSARLLHGVCLGSYYNALGR